MNSRRNSRSYFGEYLRVGDIARTHALLTIWIPQRPSRPSAVQAVFGRVRVQTTTTTTTADNAVIAVHRSAAADDCLQRYSRRPRSHDDPSSSARICPRSNSVYNTRISHTHKILTRDDGARCGRAIHTGHDDRRNTATRVADSSR